MTELKKIKRYCFIKADSGPVYLKFYVDENLVAGAEFRLYDEDGKDFFDSWKLGAQDDESIRRHIKHNAISLNRKILTWQILTCSLKAEVDSGLIGLEFYQSEHLCKLTNPAAFKVTNVPPCKIRRTQKLTQSLMFILKT